MVIKVYRSGNYMLVVNNATSAVIFKKISRNIKASNVSGLVKITNILTDAVYANEAYSDIKKENGDAYGANIADTINALNVALSFNAGQGTSGDGSSGGGGGSGGGSAAWGGIGGVLNNQTDLISYITAQVADKATLVAGKIPESLLNSFSASLLQALINDSSNNATDRTWSASKINTAINSAVAALVASSPAALDTLNELATALGNDPNFASTITNALAGKQATLVSGTNIKTVNGQTILGAGNMTINAGVALENLTDIGIWAGKFDKHYIVGSVLSPLNSTSIPALASSPAPIEGSVVTLYINSSSLSFVGDGYVPTNGVAFVPNSTILVEIEYKGGKGIVSMLPLDIIQVPSPLVVNGLNRVQVGQTIQPVYTTNLKSIQWQDSADGTTWADISGATSSSLVVPVGSVNKFVRFQAKYQDASTMFETATINSSSKFVVASTELLVDGYNITDANGNGTWDRVNSSSSSATYQVLVDANGFTGNYQRVNAGATSSSCFFNIKMDSTYNAENLKPNQQYTILIKSRVSSGAQIQLRGAGASNFVGGAKNVTANTGTAASQTIVATTDASATFKLQLQFVTNQTTGAFYEFQLSIVEG